MATQQTAPAAKVAVTQEQKSEFQRLLDKEVRLVEYVPLHGDQSIRLTPKLVLDLLAIPTKKGDMPTERDCMKFIMLCRARKLNPFEGDAWLLGYDTQDGPKFELITAHAALMKRAETHGDFNGIESGIVFTPADPCKLCNETGYVQTKADALLECPRCHGSGKVDEIRGSVIPESKRLAGGWSRILFKNKGVPTYDRVPLSAFIKSFGRWRDDASGQIQKCAEASTLRLAFPNTLGGLYTKDEMSADTPPKDTNTAPPVFDVPGSVFAPVVSDAAKEPVKEPVAEPPKKPETPAPAPVVGDGRPSDGLSVEGVILAIKDKMSQSGITDDQMNGHLRSVDMAKKAQKWGDLSDEKLRSILDAWQEWEPEIKSFSA